MKFRSIEYELVYKCNGYEQEADSMADVKSRLHEYHRGDEGFDRIDNIEAFDGHGVYHCLKNHVDHEGVEDRLVDAVKVLERRATEIVWAQVAPATVPAVMEEERQSDVLAQPLAMAEAAINALIWAYIFSPGIACAELPEQADGCHDTIDEICAELLDCAIDNLREEHPEAFENIAADPTSI